LKGAGGVNGSSWRGLCGDGTCVIREGEGDVGEADGANEERGRGRAAGVGQDVNKAKGTNSWRPSVGIGHFGGADIRMAT